MKASAPCPRTEVVELPKPPVNPEPPAVINEETRREFYQSVRRFHLNEKEYKYRISLFKDKHVDSFHITDGNGYSRTNVTVPFANSVSGTTYAFIALLKSYVNHHSKDPDLQTDLNNIFRAFFAFTCMRGYHSFAEILDVLKDEKIVSFFNGNPYKIQTEMIPNNISEVFSSAMNYSLFINLHYVLRNELSANPDSESNTPF